VEARGQHHHSTAERPTGHGARPGFVAALLFVAAVSLHFLCCEWNADNKRGRIVSFIHARESFVYASQSGDAAYNTGLAALCGLVIPGLMAAGAVAIVIYEAVVRIARRRAARGSPRGLLVTPEHLRNVAYRGRQR